MHLEKIARSKRLVSLRFSAFKAQGSYLLGSYHSIRRQVDAVPIWYNSFFQLLENGLFEKVVPDFKKLYHAKLWFQKGIPNGHISFHLILKPYLVLMLSISNTKPENENNK